MLKCPVFVFGWFSSITIIAILICYAYFYIIIDISVDPFEAIENTNKKTKDHDFDDVTNMPVVFDINEEEKTIAIGLVDNVIPENPERFVVYIAGYDGIDMEAIGHVFGIIYDDDKTTSKLKERTVYDKNALYSF